MDKPLKNLSAQEWEALIEDFQYGSSRQDRWTSQFSSLSLLDLSLSSLFRKDFPLKFHILIFLEEFAEALFFNSNSPPDQVLSKLIESLKLVIQTPIDGVSITFSLKEQMLLSATSITITLNSLHGCIHQPQLEGLLGILLTIVNRPNHGIDRQVRAVACECLRELEREYPCLLGEIVGHLWALCQSERTHASQSYLLLLLEASLLKVQFSGLLYSFDPLLCHVILMMYSQFPDAFDGQEAEIARRLILISKVGRRHLVFRLLALHWLLGFTELVMGRDARKKKLIVEMAFSFYPNVFDALALKSLKLDLLAFCSIYINVVSSETMGDKEGDSLSVKYLEDCLVCVSAFKWLPPWSTETAVAFRAFHKFLIGASSHSDTDSSTSKSLMESTIFLTIQNMLVNLMLDFQKLVPVAVALVDRFLSCQKHCWLGENLLQIFDQCLLPKVVINYRLTSYFLIFDRIGKSDTIPPHQLLELLTKFMVFLVEKHGPDTGFKSWSQGSRVLSICRTLLMHHHSSRLFIRLSHLLAFTTLSFPDLEVRDNARIYLRMLISIPGKKLRHILNLGEQLVGVSPSPHASSFFIVESPRFSQDLQKSKNISSYIHLDRVVPLLVKQSWSLSLPTLGYGADKYSYIEGIRDSEPLVNGEESDDNANINHTSEAKRIEFPQEPLRVMDSKVSEILGTLRKHFACIPDHRHMAGIKIQIHCTLRFDAEPFKRIWVADSSINGLEKVDALPAIYATVLNFTSSAPYGPIQSYRIPFLLGEPAGTDNLPRQKDSWDVVPVENVSAEKENFKAPVVIELEPREPVPGSVDVLIEANAENGRIIRGQLLSISVGIEDMFLKSVVPPDIGEDAVPDYYSDLFDALWEACGASSNTGREMFSLKGGKGIVAISGTQSVKLLEVPAAFVIRAVEQHLAAFVVGVIGETLVRIVKDGGVIKDITWKDVWADSALDSNPSTTDSDGGPLYLTYFHDEDKDGNRNIYKTNMGCLLVLIFLPPRYHLLFRMEISDVSTLVRVRTDHWPCLAYIDDYLEGLFSS
ncbi:hypothetical protein Ancab_012803 [Ancistrocladus abbreviatus]